MGASWGGGRAEQVVMDAQLGWGMARARAVFTGQVWGAVGSWAQLSANSVCWEPSRNGLDNGNE